MNTHINRSNSGALLLIGAGAILLFMQVFGINLWDIVGEFWPLAVAAPGLVFLALAWFGDRGASGFVFPGAVITGTGAILMYQNITGHWESWAYIWTLYPGLVGLALMFNGTRHEHPNEVKTGRQMLQWSVVAFVIGLIIFESFIFGSNGALTRFLLPVVLLAVGAFLLLGRRDGEKPKREYFNPPLSPRKIKPANGYHSDADVSPELRRKIDEAIHEDEPV